MPDVCSSIVIDELLFERVVLHGDSRMVWNRISRVNSHATFSEWGGKMSKNDTFWCEILKDTCSAT